MVYDSSGELSKIILTFTYNSENWTETTTIHYDVDGDFSKALKTIEKMPV